MTSEEPKVEPATPVLAPEDTFRILIMDTVEYTDLLKAACKDAGHSVIAAQSIVEAMAFLDGKDHADVIVCAVYLQDESVFEFLQRVRSEASHNDSMFMMLALEPGPVGVKLNHNVEIAAAARCGCVYKHAKLRRRGIDCRNQKAIAARSEA